MGFTGLSSRVLPALRFHPGALVALLGPLVAGWGRGLLGFVFVVGGPGGLLPRPCRVLVLLNPRGGKGKALQLFQSLVQPLLAQAEVSFMLMLTGESSSTLAEVQGASPARASPENCMSPTERRNHARELVRAEELGRWDALVVMSGDGLMHEVRPAPEAGPGLGHGSGGASRAEESCSNRW